MGHDGLSFAFQVIPKLRLHGPVLWFWAPQGVRLGSGLLKPDTPESNPLLMLQIPDAL